MSRRIRVLSIDGAGAEGLRTEAVELDRHGIDPEPILVTPRERWVADRAAGDRVVVVVRDPRDLVSLPTEHHPASALDAAVGQLSDRELLIARMADLRLAERTLRSWAGTAPSSQEQVVRFEDLVEDPGVLTTALDDLGASTGASLTSSLHKGFRRLRGEPWAEVGLWRSRFDRSLGALFESMFPGLLVELGYERETAWWEEIAAASAVPEPAGGGQPSLFGPRRSEATEADAPLRNGRANGNGSGPSNSSSDKRGSKELGLFGRRAG